MSTVILIAKFICLLFGVVYGFSNIAKVYCKQNISNAQMFLMGFGITSFIFLQWII